MSLQGSYKVPDVGERLEKRMSEMILWIVGEVTYKSGVSAKEIPGLSVGLAWEFCGVFDSKEKAEAACVSDMHFIGPAKLNEMILDSEDWPGAFYPKAVSSVKEKR